MHRKPERVQGRAELTFGNRMMGVRRGSRSVRREGGGAAKSRGFLRFGGFRRTRRRPPPAFRGHIPEKRCAGWPRKRRARRLPPISRPAQVEGPRSGG